MNQYLLNHVDVNTDGDAISGDGSSKIIQITGVNYGGGSITIQMRLDSDVDWTTLNYGGSPAIFIANITLLLNFFPKGSRLRATFTGSTGADDVTARIAD